MDYPLLVFWMTFFVWFVQALHVVAAWGGAHYQSEVIYISGNTVLSIYPRPNSNSGVKSSSKLFVQDASHLRLGSHSPVKDIKVLLGLFGPHVIIPW